jgi:hypothetical protein
MITLFSEEVQTTSTNSDHNTLYVESFEEAFFGVFEFEINGNTIIAEQIHTIDGSPVVRIPVVDVDKNKTEYDFILKEGSQKVELSTSGGVVMQPQLIEEVAVDEKLILEDDNYTPISDDDLDSSVETEYLPVTKYNTMWVEGFEEVYFDVYEFYLNGNKILAEKIDTLGEHPVVKVPFTEVNGNKIETTFVLKIGTQLNKTEIVSEAIEDDEPIMIESRNTLFVDKYEETFFGVYEFEINGNKVIAEQVDTVNNTPVVKIPVTRSNGKQVEVEFILKEGSQDSVLDESKLVLTDESMAVIKEEDLKTKLHAESKTLIEQSGATDINISYRIDKEEIIEEIKTDSAAALEKLREETKNIVDEVEQIRDSIFIEFASNSDSYRAKESKKLKLFVDEKLEELSKTNTKLAEKVKIETRTSLDSTYGSFIKKLRESQQELKERKKEHFKISNTLNVLENAHLELRDDVNVNKREILEATKNSEKSVNKALSRLGTVKKELTDSKAEFDTIKDALAHSIILAEERVKEYYHNKIEQIENTVFNNVRKDEILKVVRESKSKILTELNDTSDIKEQLREIATETYNPITGKEFQNKLKESIDEKFASEMANIRRMVELYSGGGTNAVQFANGGIMNGDLNVNGNILSGGENLTDIFGEGNSGTIAGSGTENRVTLWDGVSSITDSSLTQTSSGMILSGAFITEYIALSTNTTTLNLSANDEQGLVINGNSTISGNLSVLGEFTYIDTIVSITSALSVVNHGTGPAFYAEQTGANQPIAKFVDTEGGEIVFDDGGSVGIGTITPNEKLTVVGNISATGDINSVNIDTLTNNVSALYSYLIQNFDNNQISTATNITDFVTNYPKTGLVPGDVITLSAVNIAYVLGNNDGSALTDWFEVNLKPNFLFYKQGLSDYGVLDTIPLSSAKSTKYIVEVEDKSDGALFYGEINVVSDGTIAVASEYGLNHTTVFPFVEFGAEVITNTHIQLSAIALESKNMSNFTFKGNRSNLFG